MELPAYIERVTLLERYTTEMARQDRNRWQQKTPPRAGRNS